MTWRERSERHAAFLSVVRISTGSSSPDWSENPFFAAAKPPQKRIFTAKRQRSFDDSFKNNKYII